MAATITASFIDQFSANLHILLEQQTSRIRPTVPIEMANGEKHFFDRLGQFTASEVTTRLQTTDLQDPAHTRRMATVRKYHAGTYLDSIDKLKMLIDPTNDYAIGLARAQARNFDTIVLDAMLGTASTGRDGSGTASFDTSNQQIAHGSAGLTVAKLNQALRILQTNEVDIERERIYLVTNGRGIEDLFGDTGNQLTSFDFQNGKPISTGNFPMFRGVQIMHCERVPDETADTTYRAIMYTENALKVAMAKDLEVKTAERADLHYALQVNTYMMFGAVRMEETRIVDILFQ